MSNKRLYVLTLTSNIVRLISSILVGVILVPIHIGYWTNDQYSIWLIINSILAYLTVSNLGMNSAASILINKTKCKLHKLDILKKSILLIFIGVIFLITVLLVVNKLFDRWVLVLGKIPSEYLNESQKACFILSLFFLINVPFSLLSSAINGFYKVYIENIIQVITSFLTLVALLVNISINGDLTTFVVLIGISMILGSFIRLVYFYFIIYKNIPDSSETADFDRTSYRDVFKLGINCFIGSLASLIILNTDNLVISHFLGVEHVTSYAVTFKLFTIIFSLITVVNSSIIPLIGKHIGNKEHEKIKHNYEKTFYIINLFGGIVWIGTFCLLKDFILLWAGEKGLAGVPVIFVFGAYSFLFTIVNLNNILINTMNYIKEALGVFILEAFINLFLSIILIQFLGLIGVALGTLLGILLGPTIFFPVILKRRSQGIIGQNNRFILINLLFIIPLLFLGLYVQNLNIVFVVKVVLTLFILTIYCMLIYIIIPKNIRSEFAILTRIKRFNLV